MLRITRRKVTPWECPQMTSPLMSWRGSCSFHSDPGRTSVRNGGYGAFWPKTRAHPPPSSVVGLRLPLSQVWSRIDFVDDWRRARRHQRLPVLRFALLSIPRLLRPDELLPCCIEADWVDVLVAERMNIICISHTLNRTKKIKFNNITVIFYLKHTVCIINLKRNFKH